MHDLQRCCASQRKLIVLAASRGRLYEPETPLRLASHPGIAAAQGRGRSYQLATKHTLRRSAVDQLERPKRAFPTQPSASLRDAHVQTPHRHLCDLLVLWRDITSRDDSRAVVLDKCDADGVETYLQLMLHVFGFRFACGSSRRMRRGRKNLTQP